MSNPSVLYFSPGYKWGTIERQVLQDYLMTEQQGAKCYLYCSSNSALDIKSESFKLNSFNHNGNANLKPRSFRRMFEFEKLVLEKDIKVVHCYNIIYLSFVVLALRRLPQISIQITINRELVKNYRRPWHRLLTNRVDMIYLPARQLSENILSQLSFPRHNMCFLGLPIPDQNVDMTKVAKNKFCLGTYFCPLESNYESLAPIFNALKVIREQSLEFDITLKVFTDYELSNTFLAENMRTLITLKYLDGAVTVEKFDGLYPDFSGLDLWLEGNQHEEVQDFSVVAIERGIGLVAVRKAVSLSLSHSHEDRIYTYQDGDARELRHKILKFYNNSPVLKQKIDLPELHPKDYQKKLYFFYLRHISRRDKFIRRMGGQLKKPF